MKQTLPLICSITACSLSLAIGVPETPVTLEIDTETILQETDPRLLVGTNVSLWARKYYIEDPSVIEHVRSWQPAIIRLPGGSWSNEYYWNGNGVRIGDDHGLENFDTSKQKSDGTWEVDFSAYKPGFRVHGEDRHLSYYHGDLDVKTQHEWIQNFGSQTMATVNLGSGTPELAVEWLKWSEKNDYKVTYWEIGNELNGDWELGHRLPDGGTMTGDIYAQEFIRYAEAMQKASPDIKLGGPACSDLALDFVEELIRDGGEHLDFVSVHAYPVGSSVRESAPKFEQLEDVRAATRKIHAWIDKYQPDRKDEIEIGFTEWNLKVNEDRDTADLINGLWSAVWIGTLFEEKVDFATQWDLFTNTEKGGHGAFFDDATKRRLIPKSQYWALWMWANLMGSKLHPSTIQDSNTLNHFVTSDDEGLKIMLVNRSETDAAHVNVAWDSEKSLSPIGTSHRFSGSEYFWDPHANRVHWSTEPTQVPVNLEKGIHIEPFSILVVQLPWEAASTPSAGEIIKARPSLPRLELILPDRTPADQPFEAWVVAMQGDSDRPYLGKLPQIELNIDGPAEIDSSRVDLEHAAGTFQIIPQGAGSIKIQAKSEALSVEENLELVAISERTETIWTFDTPIAEWNAKTSYELGAATTVLPNQHVAKSILENAITAPNADLLFQFEPLPHKELLKTASGIFGKLRASHDWVCEDPDANVNIVVQSDANHWMPLGEIPISDLVADWVHFRLTVTEPNLLEAMGKLYAIRFLLAAEAPATGEIYLDDLGYVIRTGL